MPVNARSLQDRCPAWDCEGGRPHRQVAFPMSQAQLSRISGAAQELVGRHGRGEAFRCTNCGCVYLGGEMTTILGRLDGLQSGWLPADLK